MRPKSWGIELVAGLLVLVGLALWIANTNCCQKTKEEPEAVAVEAKADDDSGDDDSAKKD